MLTKILLGVIVAMLVGGGAISIFTHWKHQREVSQLTRQVEQLAGEKLALEIENKAQQATIKYLENVKKVKARVYREKEAVKEAVSSGSLDRIRDLYGKYRVQPGGKEGGSPPGQPRGGPGH